MTTLTPIQALSILDQATASLATNRQDHVKIIEAIKILNDFISSNTQKNDTNWN